MMKKSLQEPDGTGRSLWTECLRSFGFHLPLLVYIIAYAVLMVVVANRLGVPQVVKFNLYDVLPLATLIFIVAYLLGRYIYKGVFVRPPRFFRYVGRDLKAIFRERFMTALPVMIFLPLFMSVFTAFKVMIPVAHHYIWDPTFAQLDGYIHGGVQPWVWLHDLLPWPRAAYIINFVYNAWFFTMFAVVNWQAFALSKPRLRMQFLLAFVMTWSLLGSGLGTLFASVGPCYYERLLDLDLYRPLMDSLRAASEHFPIWALSTQDMLWSAHENKAVVLGSGISAMPSMHVASALLFALVGCRSNRVFGVLLSLFFVMIMIGSVFLGWHYAVDGYVSIVLGLVVWFVAGKVVNLFPLPPPIYRD